MKKRMLLGFGAALGAGVMYAFDPTSGAARRRMLQERALPQARRALSRAQPLAQQALEQAQPLAQQARAQAHQAFEQAQPFTQQARAQAHQALDRVQPLAQQAKDRVQPLAQQALDRVQPLAQQAKDRVQPLTEGLSGPLHGMVARATRTLRGDDASLTADDATLRDRVLSELGHAGLLHGASVNVEQAIVVLRGEHAGGADVALRDRLLAIPGVQGVEDLRHAPGTPAPQGAVSEHRAEQFAAASEAADETTLPA